MNRETNITCDLASLLGFGLIEEIISFVPWERVEEFEKKGWWILQEQKGYASNWYTGGIFMAKLVPNLSY